MTGTSSLSVVNSAASGTSGDIQAAETASPTGSTSHGKSPVQAVLLASAPPRPVTVPLGHNGISPISRNAASEQSSSARNNSVPSFQFADSAPSRGEGFLPPQGELPVSSNASKLAVIGMDSHGTRVNLGSASLAAKRDTAMWRDLDAMDEEIHSEHKVRMIAGSASLVSVGVSVMYFIWAAGRVHLKQSLVLHAGMEAG